MGKPKKRPSGVGRFSTSLTTETIAFTHSIEADTRLIGYDIWGSQAHAIMLARQEIISDADLREIFALAPEGRSRFSERRFYPRSELKRNVHMNVEAYLIENAGREFRWKTPYRAFSQ